MTQAYDRLKAEVALRLGDNEPFGVVNVGKASELAKALEDRDDLVVSENGLSPSLFAELNERGEEFEDHHVLFQEEDKHTYVRTMLERILSRG